MLGLLLSLTMLPAVASVIPSKTETPFFRIYTSVKLKPAQNTARVSVSRLFKTGSGREPKDQWEFQTGHQNLEIPLPFFQEVRTLADSVLKATPGDDSNSFGTAFHIGGGYILTNQHVLSTSRKNTTECKSFTTKTGDGKDSFRCDHVVYCDRTADFCLIKLKAWKKNKREPHTLPALSLHSTHEPDREALYATIGNPMGEGLHFARGRGIRRHREGKFMFYAPVHSGNSGGPLLNEAGEVVGLVFAQGQYGVTEEGYNLAVPVEFIVSELTRVLDPQNPGLMAVQEALLP